MLGIALMSLTESIAAGRAFARKEDPRPVPNRELIALGAANLAGSFFHSFPAGGGTGQTAVNFGAGDLVVFPCDLECTWHVHEPVTKHYNFS